ncbi:MAG: hypothetical protein N4A47_03005 [Clostridia bacterium]|jgi:hypothetical protein|nr:hypothetical protein [Clostridia bacterium]
MSSTSVVERTSGYEDIEVNENLKIGMLKVTDEEYNTCEIEVGYNYNGYLIGEVNAEKSAYVGVLENSKLLRCLVSKSENLEDVIGTNVVVTKYSKNSYQIDNFIAFHNIVDIEWEPCYERICSLYFRDEYRENGYIVPEFISVSDYSVCEKCSGDEDIKLYNIGKEEEFVLAS